MSDTPSRQAKVSTNSASGPYSSRRVNRIANFPDLLAQAVVLATSCARHFRMTPETSDIWADEMANFGLQTCSANAGARGTIVATTIKPRNGTMRRTTDDNNEGRLLR